MTQLTVDPSDPAARRGVFPPCSERIRAELKELHDAIEDLPIARRMVEATITREEYALLLRQLMAVHEWIESAWDDAGTSDVPAGPRIKRSEYVRQDLQALGVHDVGLLPATSDAVGFLATSVREHPLRLAGVSYVMEGARMGSMILLERLSRALRVPVAPRHGLDYHLIGLGDVPRRWREFKTSLDASVTDREAVDEVVDSARAAMVAMGEIHRACQPDAGKSDS